MDQIQSFDVINDNKLLIAIYNNIPIDYDFNKLPINGADALLSLTGITRSRFSGYDLSP